jgi:two-component system cell cycle sensor histidine kinase/response regulator CckA
MGDALRFRKVRLGLSEVVVIFLGLILSLTAFLIAWDLEEKNLAVKFKMDAYDIVSSLRRNLKGSLYELESIASLYAVSPGVRRQDFREFVKPYLSRNLGIQALEWIPRLPASKRAAYEQSARQEGFPDFQITEKDSQGHLVRAGARPEYFPVYFVEPSQGNEVALGYDLASDPTRLKTLTLARDLGEARATAPIRLVQETASQQGFLIYWPLYRRDAPLDSLEARRAKFTGFALGVFRIGNIVEKALKYLEPRGHEVFLFDRSAPPGKQLLYSHDSGSKEAPINPQSDQNLAPQGSSLHYAAAFDLAGRRWQVLVKPGADFLQEGRTWQPWGMLLGGLLFVFLTVYLIHHRRAEEMLRGSERFLASIFTSIQDGLIILDNELNIVRVNPAMEHRVAAAGPILGKKCYEIIHGRREPCVPCPACRTLETGKAAQEIQLDRRPDGTIGECLELYTFARVDNSSGKMNGVVVYVRDITEHKRAEEARAKLAEILEATTDLVATADSHGGLLYLNQAGRRLLGIGPEEDISGVTFSSTHSAGAAEIILNEALPAARQQGVWVGETVFRARDGREFLASQVILVHKTMAGEEKFLSTIARDITEHQRDERALQKSEKKYRLLVSQIPAMVFQGYGDWSIDPLDDKVEVLTGYSKEDFESRRVKWCDLIPAEDLDYAAKVFIEALKTNKSYVREHRLRRKDGGIIWVQCRGQIFLNDQGKVDHISGVSFDVTQRRQAEEAVREGERFLADIFASIQDGINIMDTDYNIIRVNPTFERWYDHARPLVGKKCYEAIHGRQEPCEVCSYRETLETGQVGYKVSPRKGKDGAEPDWMEIFTFPITDRVTGQVKGVIEYVRDITEQKQAVAALQESEDWLKTILDNIQTGILIIDPETKVIVDMNPAAAKMIGASKEQMVGSSYQQNICPTEKGKCPITDLGQVVDNSERLLIRADGERRNIIRTVAPATMGGRTYFLESFIDITERKQAEDRLCESESRYSMLLKNLPQKIFLKDRESVYISCNENYALDLGISPNQIKGMTDYDFHPKELAEKYRIDDKRVMEEGSPADIEEQYIQDGKEAWIHTVKTPVRDERGNTIGILGIFWDITSQKQAEEALRRSEEQLRQAVKMEAVGRLAGGVAHDFNNILTAITGYGELLLMNLDSKDSVRQDVQDILVAAERAASLTRQLLAFSRKQVLQPQRLDLNRVVGHMDKMLRRIIGEDIDLVTVLGPELGTVTADPGQIEQVVMNLAVNARDAMPQGGKLTIETADVDLDEAYAQQHLEVQPGPYVMLAVSDTGVGLDQEAQARIFEPFFTTKEMGKGTGLGLSTVYGIVKQSGGLIWVYSEPGKGTTFKIYLPRLEGPGDAAGLYQVPGTCEWGSETILLVEDEDLVRQVARRILARHGYSVLEAASGDNALVVSREHAGPIHLMLTDVVMPGMGVQEIMENLKSQRPEMKVLFMSGHTENAIVHHGVLNPGTAFIQKPFKHDFLAHKVREVLDNPAPG